MRVALERLVAFTAEDRFMDHPAQEDHRGIVSGALADLEEGTAAGLGASVPGSVMNNAILG